MDLSLKNKSALVCGSSRGIGKASALELASLGASVTLVARCEEDLVSVLEQMPRSENQTHGYICTDFSDPEDLRSKVAAFTENNSPLHILINNTGGPAAGPVVNAKPEEFNDAFSKHLICNHILVQLLLPGMKVEGFGRIINIISTSVREPIKGLGVSNTTRGAVAGWSKTLAGEVSQYGITVNNILPGPTDTERLQNLIEQKASKQNKTSEQVRQEFVEQVPLGRIGTPEEIAAAVAFLASPAASFISGVSLPVDGGRLASI